MKHIVSYSGGVGSAITAQLIVDLYGKNNTALLFADTKVESPDLYRFNHDIENLLGCEFITIADGRTPWQVFNDEKFIGNSRIDPCSKILKRNLIKKWLRENFKSHEVTVWVGIDVTEEHRLPPVVANNYPYIYRSILVELQIFVTPDIKRAWCKENKILIPNLYELGFSHNNCGGFCVKAGLAQFKKLYELLPEVYMENEKEELAAMVRNPNLRPFLKKTINGVKHYITMKEYREKYLSQLTPDEELEFGGCGCAL